MLFFITNTILVTSTLIMGLLFWVLPLPQAQGLKNYRTSLKVLATAYFAIGGLTCLSLYAGFPQVDLLSPIELTIASLQAILFTFSLITLLSPAFVSVRLLARHLLPVVLFTGLWPVFAAVWGCPNIGTLQALGQKAAHPTVVLRFLFLLCYAAQLVYLSRMFFLEEKKYDRQLGNYFADNYRLQLKWVRYCFYAALAVGITVLCSFFISTPGFIAVSPAFYAAFYVGFGFFYIQYPKTFVVVEKAITGEPPVQPDVNGKELRLQTWNKLRQEVIDKQYYLVAGVNIEEVAQHLKISRTALSGYINKEAGVNFNTWINILRIDEAKKLMVENPDFSIAVVAEMVGFSEQSNFSRQFKSITQQSPSAWRQQQQA